jgi:hypothetical protein
MVSLIDVCEEGDQGKYRVRLAGTGLYSYFGGEATGKMLGEVLDETALEYWQRILSVLVTRRKPACGATGPGKGGRDLCQFWLRLPLIGKDGQVNMVLGYDLFTPLSALSPDNRARLAIV